MAKLYRDVGSTIRDGLKEYVDDVRSRRFPGEENRFSMPEEELALLERRRPFKRTAG
jgi:3-methyl-2-oxobutanoate hydroxymethyltransferase